MNGNVPHSHNKCNCLNVRKHRLEYQQFIKCVCMSVCVCVVCVWCIALSIESSPAHSPILYTFPAHLDTVIDHMHQNEAISYRIHTLYTEGRYHQGRFPCGGCTDISSKTSSPSDTSDHSSSCLELCLFLMETYCKYINYTHRHYIYLPELFLGWTAGKEQCYYQRQYDFVQKV